MSGVNAFYLDGTPSTDFGILMQEPPKIPVAERDVETIDIPGRHGSLTVDHKRYKNVHPVFKCAMLVESGTMDQAEQRLNAFLQSTAGYRRLETTYEPGIYRMARVEAGISLEKIQNQAGYFDVRFDMKPQRFLISGETPVKCRPSQNLRNSGMPSLPLIRLTRSGPGSFSVGDFTVKIQGEGDLVIDCENQNAYRELPGGAIENANSSLLSVDEFPVLQPGDNPVTWSAEIQSFEVAPRWWKL